MKKKFSLPVIMILIIMGLFNFFVVTTDFGPTVALARDPSHYCMLLFYSQNGETCYDCQYTIFDKSWGCVLCPWNTCD